MESPNMKKSKKLSAEAILNSLPGHVYWKDVNGVILGCNQQQAISFGFKNPKELIGKNNFEISPKPEFAEIWSKSDQEVIRTGIAKVVEEPAIINGLEVIVLSHKLPLKDDTDKIIGILGTSIDISAHKKTEQALASARDQAEIALDNIIARLPGHVYWKDRNSIYLGCNDRQAKSAGLKSRYEILGKTDYDLPWGKQADVFQAIDQQVMETGTEYSVEESGVLADGRWATFISKKVPLLDSSGQTTGTLGISFDITERKALEKEAAEVANHAKDLFLEHICGDISGPLSGIIGYAGLIKVDTKEAKIKGYAENLIASTEALGVLLESILESVREVPPSRKKFDLRTQLEHVIHFNQARAQEKKIALQLEYDAKIPHYLVGDNKRVHRIILELVGNALKFTEQGSIQVSASLAKAVDPESRQTIVKIVVKDTGIGIPKNQHDQIFTRFHRLSNAQNNASAGYGLGLAVARQFMDDLNGELYVESEPGQGSTFTCIIPLKQALLEDNTGLDGSLALRVLSSQPRPKKAKPAPIAKRG
jgi:two-component system aerobic respiration control sensor histidine kinase ArcB